MAGHLSQIKMGNWKGTQAQFECEKRMQNSSCYTCHSLSFHCKIMSIQMINNC